MKKIQYTKEHFMHKPEIARLLNQHWDFNCFSEGCMNFETYYKGFKHLLCLIPKEDKDFVAKIDTEWLLDNIKWPVDLLSYDIIGESETKRYYYVDEYLTDND